MRRAFTLIELLVVIAIIAVLAVVVVLVLNPAELLKQSRDSNRVSDIDTLTHALSIYQSDQGGAAGYTMGNASSVYVSLPDPTLTGASTSTCASLGLPALPSGYAYQCSSPQDYRNVNGTGWLPVDFASTTTGSPLGSLPIDPINNSSTGLYYVYSTNGNQFEVTSLFESSKYKTQYGQNPLDPYYPEVNAKGSSLAISPLYNPTGLVGYWPMDEGTGSSTIDQSGNGNNGTWNGNVQNGSYYAGGKIGSYAGNFDGSTDYISTGYNNLPLGNGSRSMFAWVYATGPMTNIYYVEAYGGNGSAATASGLRIEYPGGNLWWSGAGDDFKSNFIVTPNAWHLVGYTYSGGATLTIYYDGQPQTGSITQLNTILPASDISNIGKASDGQAYYFNGLIDDVRIYNRALSTAEIQAFYNAGK